MICKIFGIDLLDFQGFNSRNFRKPILFEDTKKRLKKIELKQGIFHEHNIQLYLGAFQNYALMITSPYPL
jgi:hypothetical protein